MSRRLTHARGSQLLGFMQDSPPFSDPVEASPKPRPSQKPVFPGPQGKEESSFLLSPPPTRGPDLASDPFPLRAIPANPPFGRESFPSRRSRKPAANAPTFPNFHRLNVDSMPTFEPVVPEPVIEPAPRPKPPPLPSPLADLVLVHREMEKLPFRLSYS